MKSLGTVVAILVSTFALSGCNELCKNGMKLKGDLHGLEQALAPADPVASLDQSCAWLNDQNHHAVLSEGAKFMESVAYSKFYAEDSRCRAGYWHRDPWCHRDYAFEPHGYYHRRPRHRHRHCWDEWVCTDREVTPIYRPGFNEARNVAQGLRDTHATLNWACVKRKAGETLVATPLAMAVKYTYLPMVKDNGEYVLHAAGCYK